MPDCFETERIVNDMRAKAEKVLCDVLAEFKISHVLAGFSGGDDSIVATHWAMNRFPDACVMVADTQVGLQATRDHQRKVIADQGWHVEIDHPDPEGPNTDYKDMYGLDWVDGETSYEELVLNHGFPGHPQHHRMYRRLKQRAFRKTKRKLGKRPRGSRVLVVSGIREDESAIRAGYKRAFADEATERFVWMNPFYYCSARDFEAYRQEFGLPRNPVKAQCGISGECCCGAHAAPGEREAYKVVEPEFDEYLNNLEQRVMERFPWPWEHGPPKWWLDQRRGQTFLFDVTDGFMPACVGCKRKQAKYKELRHGEA